MSHDYQDRNGTLESLFFMEQALPLEVREACRLSTRRLSAPKWIVLRELRQRFLPGGALAAAHARNRARRYDCHLMFLKRNVPLTWPDGLRSTKFIWKTRRLARNPTSLLPMSTRFLHPDPKMLERIIRFAYQADAQIAISFCGSSMFVAIDRIHSILGVFKAKAIHYEGQGTSALGGRSTGFKVPQLS